jgi:hypothetical protein
MSRWAALESSCVREKDVIAWIVVASRTTPTIKGNFPACRLTKTLSTRNLVDAGRTRPETRLMTIKTKPNASSHLRGLISVQISGSTLRRGGRFFSTSPPAAPPRDRVDRSARRDIPAPALDRILTR